MAIARSAVLAVIICGLISWSLEPSAAFGWSLNPGFATQMHNNLKSPRSPRKRPP